MAGRPTLTTEPSTNARLEARIVVASTRRGCSDVATRVAALAVAASQATLSDVLIVRFYGLSRSGAGHIRATLDGSATSNSCPEAGCSDDLVTSTFQRQTIPLRQVSR